MDISTLTDKGQITIPAELRRSLGLKKGDKILFSKTAENTLTMQKISKNDGEWHKFAFSSFTEWDSPEDSVYDSPHHALHDKEQDDFTS